VLDIERFLPAPGQGASVRIVLPLTTRLTSSGFTDITSANGYWRQDSRELAMAPGVIFAFDRRPAAGV
jgi:hypothetical protein